MRQISRSQGNRAVRRQRIPRYAELGILLFLLIFSTQLAGQERGISNAASSNSAANAPSFPYADNALSLLNPSDRLTLQSLEKLSNGSQSVSTFEKVIQDYFLTLNIRRVLLDIGWQNYTVGTVPYEQWVDNWLTACDYLGVQNIFYVGQFTSGGIGSPWVTSLIAKDPTVQTYYSNGQSAPFIDLSSPDVALQMEEDLSALYSYYGNQSSWVGIGTGSGANNPYFSSNSTVPMLGYSNASLASFANSIYFKRDVNQTGYDSNGILDKLWSSFVSSQPAIMLSSGNWMTSSAVDLYPAGQNALAMRFYIPSKESEIQLQWYGNKVGNPGSLSFELFADANDTLPKSPLSTGNLSSSTVSTSAGWQRAIQLYGNLPSGYYWILLSALSGDSADYYAVYARNYYVDPAEALSAQSAAGPWSNIGSSILWIKDVSGADLAIYPYEQAVVGVQNVQSFLASSSYSFNTVFLFLSDRHFSNVNGTLEILDASTNQIIATGVLSQSLNRGLQNWIPISLNTAITTVPGHTYSIEVFEPNGGYSWHVVQRGLTVNPTSAGFQNQSQFWLFRLAYANWQLGHLDITSMTVNGVDAVKSGYSDAIRISAPGGASATLNEISVLMANSNPTVQFYQSGTDLTISILNDNSTGPQPLGPPIQSLSVPGQLVPQNGWLNVTGFNVSFAGNAHYWAVFSTNSPGANFPMARLVSPYNLQVLVSLDNGTSWFNPAEGPTEFSFAATFSNGEQIGNFIQAVPHVIIGPSDSFAQPFISNGSQAIGVYIGPIVGTSNPSDYVKVSINPDNGGKPASTQLASGALYSGNITLDYGPQFVQFSSVARLGAGQKYWIVMQPISGDFALLPVVYTKQPANFPAGFTSLISQDGGFSWKPVENETAILTFLIASLPIHLTEYNTATLYNDLQSYHNFPIDPSYLRGWNAYVEASQLSNYQTIAAWAQNFTGRGFNFFANGDPALASVLGLNNVVLSQSNSTTSCSELLQYLLAQVPYQSNQYHEVGGFSTLSSCDPAIIRPLAQELNYMLYSGPSFGSTTNLQVLVLGSEATSNLTNYLAPAFNATYINLATDSNLTLAHLDGFKAVVWMPEPSQSSYSSLQGEFEAYVKSGGNLLVLQTPQSWMSDLIGFDPSSIHLLNSTLSSSTSNLLTDFVSHTAYSGTLKLGGVSSTAAVGLSSGLVESVNYYGSGSAMFLQSQSETQLSDYTVLLGNILSSLVGSGQTSPLWYGANGTPSSSLLYDVKGKAGGPILVWVSNPASSPQYFSLNLDAKFFGLAGNWMSLDLLHLNATSGSGSAIGLGFTVPPNSWEPIYVFENSPNLFSSYSSIALVGHQSYPNQALFEFASFGNQPALAALSSPPSALAVQLASGQNLTQLASAKDLANSTGGWFYDSQSGLLLVKFNSSGADTLRVFFSSQASIFPVSTVLWILLGGVVAAEALVLVYSKGWARRLRGSTSQIPKASVSPLG